ncbi:MAG: hypothetical protein IPG76_03850 [Acidobacteria bacterium]|nr:hypothetical protein [Acidobacteriota bacterium]
MLQDVLRRSQKAFDNFFRRVKAGQKPGYPRFKGKAFFDSFVYPQSGFSLEDDKLHLSKIGSCRVRSSRPIEGGSKPAQSNEKPMAGMSCLPLNAINPASSRRPGGNGDRPGHRVLCRRLQWRARLKTRNITAPPKVTQESTAHRCAPKKNKRSNRRRKAINILARKHLHIKRQRADFHHKTALWIRRYDHITIED